jgi:hypothetical protein
VASLSNHERLNSQAVKVGSLSFPDGKVEIKTFELAEAELVEESMDASRLGANLS